MAPQATVAAEQRPAFNNAVFSQGMFEFSIGGPLRRSRCTCASYPGPLLASVFQKHQPVLVVSSASPPVIPLIVPSVPRPLNALHQRFPLSAACPIPTQQSLIPGSLVLTEAPPPDFFTSTPCPHYPVLLFSTALAVPASSSVVLHLSFGPVLG